MGFTDELNDSTLDSLTKRRFANEKKIDDINMQLYLRSKRLFPIRRKKEIQRLTKLRDEVIAEYSILVREARKLPKDTPRDKKEVIELIQIFERDIEYLKTLKI